MNAVRWIAVGGLIPTILACGGLGEPGTAFTVLPRTATVAKGGTLKIAMVVANADVLDYEYTVVGGNTNGTVVPVFNDHARAIYTAPQSAGMFIVRASFVKFGGQVLSTDVAITVP